MLILRRDRRAGYEPFVRRLLHKSIEEELSRTADDGINLFQIFFVAAEFITVPQVIAQPGTARWPHAPIWPIDRTGGAPKVGIVMSNPTVRAIHLLGSSRAGL